MHSNSESLNKLQELKTALDDWRLQQTGRKPIPQQFWDKAFELLASYSVGFVSRELRLDYKKLKKHLLAATITRQSNAPPQFLELAAGELAKSASSQCQHSGPIILPQATVDCRIIFERSDGNRLTLHLPTDWLKIEAICNNFLRG